MTGADRLEVYTVRAHVSGRLGDEPAQTVARLLEDIARRCEEAGCSLIGHIKCHVRAGEARFHCNLTSRRTGARCSPARRGRVGDLEMDLAVLVYGLPRERVEAVVREGFAAAFSGAGAQWTLAAPRLHSC